MVAKSRKAEDRLYRLAQAIVAAQKGQQVKANQVIAPDKPKVEPCVWCGRTPFVDLANQSSSASEISIRGGAIGLEQAIRCNNPRCGAAGPFRRSKKSALQAWNKAVRAF